MTAHRFGLETVREAVSRRVEETTLRQVADEIPMSFSGLRSFLKGGTPQPATRAKLVAWYAHARGGRRISKRDVEAALSLIQAHIAEPPTQQLRDRRRRQIMNRLSG